MDFLLRVIIFTFVLIYYIKCEEEEFLSSSIVNPHDYKYLINPGESVCKNKGDEVFLLIYVHSSPKNLKNRMAIRETWSNHVSFPTTRTLFMMGKTEDENTKESIGFESETYNDIVQEDFIDTYRNLTYKALMAFKWIKEYCPKVKYILKTDDDVMVNTYALINHLRAMEHANITLTKTIMCHTWVNARVERNKNSKWYVPKEELKNDKYKSYCAGAAYMLTPDLPEIFFEKSKYIRFFWIDDYYITGLLTYYTNSTLVNIESLFILYTSQFSDLYKFKKASPKIFSHISKQLNPFYQIWPVISKRNEIMNSNSEDFIFLNKS